MRRPFSAPSNALVGELGAEALIQPPLGNPQLPRVIDSWCCQSPEFCLWGNIQSELQPEKELWNWAPFASRSHSVLGARRAGVMKWLPSHGCEGLDWHMTPPPPRVKLQLFVWPAGLFTRPPFSPADESLDHQAVSAVCPPPQILLPFLMPPGRDPLRPPPRPRGDLRVHTVPRLPETPPPLPPNLHSMGTPGGNLCHEGHIL